MTDTDQTNSVERLEAAIISEAKESLANLTHLLAMSWDSDDVQELANSLKISKRALRIKETSNMVEKIKTLTCFAEMTDRCLRNDSIQALRIIDAECDSLLRKYSDKIK